MASIQSHRLRTGAVLLLLALLSAVITPSGVAAKPELERSSPAGGDTLEHLPPQIELWFTEPVDPATTQIMVIAPNGLRIDNGVLEFAPDDPEGRHVLVTPLAVRDSGHYTVRVLIGSPNTGDESSDSFSFTVDGKRDCDGPSSAGPVTPGESPCLSSPPEVSPGEAAVLPGGEIVEVTISNDQAGPVDITVILTDADGNPLPDARVWVRARHLDMDHGEFPHEAAGNGSGTYMAEYVGMGMGGDWRIAVDVIAAPGEPAQTVFVLQTMEEG